MEPLNIIKSQTEQKQNSVAPIITPRQPMNGIDWRIISILVLSLFALWGIASIVAGFYCSYGVLCGVQSFVFWSVPTILFIGFTGVVLWGAFYGILYARTLVQKSRFANTFTHHFDVWATSEAMQRYMIEKVAHEVAKSLATAEVDTLTYSPHTTSEVSTTSVQTADEQSAAPEIPIDKDKSILESLQDTGKIGRSNNSLLIGFANEQ